MSCHKNNVAGETTCATCGREPAATEPVAQADRRSPTKPKPMSAKERERVLSSAGDAEPLTQAAPPRSGRLRFSGDTRTPRRPSTAWRTPLEEPTLFAPVPPGISTAPPPARFTPAPPAPPAYPRRRSMAWVAKAGFWVVAVSLEWQFGLPWVTGLIAEQTSGASTGGSTEQTTTQPCPPEAASALPGQAGTLIVRYQTARHVITVCQTSDGQMFYDGQLKGQPPGPDTHISLPAQPAGDGYIAHNGTYTYQITGGRIVVTDAGTLILDEVLQPA